MSFLYPENDEYHDNNEQQNNSKTAIASGELVGKRFSKEEDVSSVNDGNFVSENQTDFIFAVAGEEFGFIGCAGIIIALFCISAECIRMGLRAKRLCRENHLLQYGRTDRDTEYDQYCRCHRNLPQYRNPASFYQLRLKLSAQSLYRYGCCIECRTSGAGYDKELKTKSIYEKMKSFRERNIYENFKIHNRQQAI